MLDILQVVACIGTILIGLYSLLRPNAVTGFTGLAPQGPRGVTEIRAILGGFFVGLGIAPLALGDSAAYITLGIAYLVVVSVRLASIFADGSSEQSNWVSFVIEVILGVILVL